jgi:Flp pilus assembly protein TadG
MSRRDQSRRKQAGAATVEMTLVGIPIIFTLISIFEISRGMWMYHTLAYAAKEGTRYAIVHGQNCVPNPPSVLNSCEAFISNVASVIQNAGVGLGATTSISFQAPPGSSGTTCPLFGAGACSTLTATPWPPTSVNSVGFPIQIEIKTTFTSALAMLFPGWRPITFATATLGASSTDEIQF